MGLRNMQKEASDEKVEEKSPQLKSNFRRGLCSSFLLSVASFTELLCKRNKISAFLEIFNIKFRQFGEQWRGRDWVHLKAGELQLYQIPVPYA